ncbi:MAG: tetratricopeptide repeat protein, partial [Acidimicrobiales bacterium]|nr:tetratricopeptide repeat protein [Acidimicrobiales bacterium]
MIDGAATVERLRERIATVDRRRDPHEHATLAYRQGLAHAEATSAEPQENLRTALQWYDRALEGFDAVYDPVPHARVLNAVGAALRSLGRLPDAIARFEKASTLLQG